MPRRSGISSNHGSVTIFSQFVNCHLRPIVYKRRARGVSPRPYLEVPMHGFSPPFI